MVLDASMALAWLFEDETSPATDDALELATESGAVVPNLWRLEITNVLLIAVRRGRCDQAHVDLSLERLAKLLITVDDQTDERAWSDTLLLARRHELTTYDACYLELALRSGLPLASRDKALLQAGKNIGIAVF